MSGQVNILLGISGGIAAYKTPDLVRRLRERGAAVQIVLTRSAEEFVTPTSLQAVSGRPIRSNIWDKEAEAAMGHIELARWADIIFIAPATAEIISRLASGSAPDLLSTVCLASEAEIAIAPAMNRVMWSNAAVQANIATLQQRGVRVLGPGVGSQACGEQGAGRMLDPDLLARELIDDASTATRQGALSGKTVMVTAGPTREAVDPVRYITNRSSGKMGYAIAQAARDEGAKVVLVSGPTALEMPRGVDVVEVESAADLYAAVHEAIAEVDIFIAAAAVADYRPANVHTSKIKKSDSSISINMVRTPDTLATVAALADGPFCVGFAAETEQLREYALGKLANKNLDMIIANKVGDGLVFDKDENAVEVFWKGGEQAFATTPKSELAVELLQLITAEYQTAAATAAD